MYSRLLMYPYSLFYQVNFSILIKKSKSQYLKNIYIKIIFLPKTQQRKERKKKKTTNTKTTQKIIKIKKYLHTSCGLFVLTGSMSNAALCNDCGAWSVRLPVYILILNAAGKAVSQCQILIKCSWKAD